MRQDILDAFELIADTLGYEGQKAEMSLDDVAKAVLEEDEYVVFTMGYTKDGTPVIGYEGGDACHE